MQNNHSNFINNNISNKSMAIALLFSHKEMSRTDLAERLDISNAAVTSIVNDYLNQGLVIDNDEESPATAGPGRRKTLLSVNSSWKYILALDIHSHFVNIALTDLLGNVFSEISTYEPDFSSPEKMCQDISDQFGKMTGEADIKPEQILGAGITIVGPVNHDLGIALNPFGIFNKPVDIKSDFEREFPFPVFIENNACATLKSEMLYTDIADSANNILMLRWGPGCGSAVAIYDQIFKGSNYLSPEIGHSQIDDLGRKLCSCGRRGCLEPSISTDAIIDHINSLPDEVKSSRTKDVFSRLGPANRSNCMTYITEGGPDVTDFVKKCASQLAVVTSNTIQILAPDKLVLSGDLFENDLIVDIFKEQLLSINPMFDRNMCIKSRMYPLRKYAGCTATLITGIML